jgi:hypothetical protein
MRGIHEPEEEVVMVFQITQFAGYIIFFSSETFPKRDNIRVLSVSIIGI